LTWKSKKGLRKNALERKDGKENCHCTDVKLAPERYLFRSFVLILKKVAAKLNKRENTGDHVCYFHII